MRFCCRFVVLGFVPDQDVFGFVAGCVFWRCVASPPIVCWGVAGWFGEKAPQAKNWFFRVFLEVPRNCRWCFWTPLDEISLCVNFQHLKKPGQKDLCEARRLTQAQTSTPRKLALCEASCLTQVFFQRFSATFTNDKGRPKEP